MATHTFNEYPNHLWLTPEASEPEYCRECDGGLVNKVSGEDGNKANQAKSIVDAR